ncbi:unnamed protein product [Soboliphyme baturini]|uniref:Secreted protein n=1 Tax=Soboliphyme baturini TaxID=241478 RepID=A0A183IA09_9BILA|nr:unnamed protein product [Soboliphyme baturini]
MFTDSFLEAVFTADTFPVTTGSRPNCRGAYVGSNGIGSTAAAARMLWLLALTLIVQQSSAGLSWSLSTEALCRKSLNVARVAEVVGSSVDMWAVRLMANRRTPHTEYLPGYGIWPAGPVYVLYPAS